MRVQSPLGTFPCVHTAAKAHGVSYKTVYSQISKHGSLDKLGTGTARPNNTRKPRVYTMADGRKMTARQIAEHTGKPMRTINWWIRNGHADRIMAVLVAADMEAA